MQQAEKAKIDLLIMLESELALLMDQVPVAHQLHLLTRIEAELMEQEGC